MLFEVKSSSFNYRGSLSECMTVLQSKNVMVAIHIEETGLGFSMMRLNVGDTISVEDTSETQFTITRI